eukprot:UN33905
MFVVGSFLYFCHKRRWWVRILLFVGIFWFFIYDFYRRVIGLWFWFLFLLLTRTIPSGCPNELFQFLVLEGCFLLCSCLALL